jgi:hypothetical protein
MIEGRKNYAQLGRIAPREHETMSVSRHCEEQSDEAIHTYFAATWIASLALAMTVSTRAATFTAVIARLDRAIQYPEASVIEPERRGVLDTPHARGMTQSSYAGLTRLSINLRKEHFLGAADGLPGQARQ